MQCLYEKIYAAWEPYTHLPSRLPEDLQQRHTQIYIRAIDISKRKAGMLN